MTPPVCRSRLNDLGKEQEAVAETGSDTDDDFIEDTENDISHGQSVALGHLASLDDGALFDVFKKIVCSSIRQFISEASAGGSTSTSLDVAGLSSGHIPGTKAVTKLNVSYFSDVLKSLNRDKKKVIKSYGFGSLLLFDNCTIPMSFARWVVDHIKVNRQAIVVSGKSIPITPRIVHDVLGIPIGGKTISKPAERGKIGLLQSMGMSTLPSAKVCGENLLKDDISEDDLVRNFLIVALVTFLCPYSNLHPSPEYLKPLVDVKKAEEWDWSKFVHYWLFKQITKYHEQMKKGDHATITMGGCLYILCVVYLDSLNIGQPQLPPTLPRILVWKGDMIKEKSKLDCVQGHSYGKHPVLTEPRTLHNPTWTVHRGKKAPMQRAYLLVHCSHCRQTGHNTATCASKKAGEPPAERRKKSRFDPQVEPASHEEGIHMDQYFQEQVPATDVSLSQMDTPMVSQLLDEASQTARHHPINQPVPESTYIISNLPVMRQVPRTTATKSGKASRSRAVKKKTVKADKKKAQSGK